MAWRWLRHVKNDNLDYTFAVPAQTFTYQSGFFSFGVGAEKSVDAAAYAEGNAAITFTAGQDNVVNLVNDPQSLITLAGKGAGAAVQWEFGTGFPWYFTFKTWAIRNYTNRTNITGAAATLSMNQSSGEYYARNVGVFLCAIINDETEELYLGLITQQQYLRFDDINNRYSRSNQTVYMCCAYDSNVYNILASSESGGGGGGDPYENGGYSIQDGGGGDFDDSSDVIALPSTPALNLSLNHFISAYVPSINDINDLADWIWGNYDKFDSTKVLGKIFTEPMESILSLHMLPFTPASSTAIAVTIGNFATGLTMKPLTLQFTDIDCGSLSFTEFWGNYLDYNPYTKIVLCLPFVGQVDLDADEVMGKSVSVKYRVDNLTGAFVCFVYIDSDKILGQYSGECMLQVPVTAGSYAAMNAAIATIACTAAASFGGATAAAIGGGYGGMIGVEKGLQMGGQALGETLASGASNVNGMKLQVSHSGALTGTAGFLGVMKPYAIIHRPRQCVPEHYNEMAGYPSNITKTLGDCSGFTSVRTMVYDGLPFTDGEILALDSILKGGIII